MKVIIEKLTNIDLAHKAIQYTTGHRFTPKAPLNKIYAWEHSITRTQMFTIEMIQIPTYVSVHFVRHKIGVEHFVQSNRSDRGGKENVDRHTPVDHLMLLNAEALINISHRRLCFQSSEGTRNVMFAIKEEMKNVDLDLYEMLVPKCFYRNGICSEPKHCGKYPVKHFVI